MGSKAPGKKKEQSQVDRRRPDPPNTLWQEWAKGVVSIWKEELEDNLGAVGKTVNFLGWLFIIVAAPVAIHLLGWVLFTLSSIG
jgi:hypothetical protein